MTWKILQGDNRETLKTLADNSIDAIVTDPPYGIDFLGKDWDANTGALETYQECLRVLKPGGHLLAFSAARTYHHLAITLEQAGFEIRDQIMWIYSSGFPKSQDIGKSIDRAAGKKDPNYGSKKTAKQGNETVGDFSSGARCGKCNRTFNADIIKDCKQEPCGMRYTHQTEDGKAWSGWGTALKPAHEPIALARKPIKLSIAKNAQKWGVGALNIDATRIPTDDNIICGAGNDNTFNKFNAENNVDGPGTGTKINKDVPKWQQAEGGRFPSNVIGEIPDYQKYFYCPKVSRKERHIGFDTTNIPTDSSGYQGTSNGGNYVDKKQKAGGEKGNNHPTVKPIELMKYLIKLITPPGGIVLDPFNGSGSTGCAAVALGYEYIGCELDPAYVEISEKRIDKWFRTADPIRASGLFEVEE